MKKTCKRVVYETLLLLLVLIVLLPIVHAQEVITNPLDELLPPIIYNPGHDPTYPLQEPEWYYGNSWTETLNESEFLEGKAIQFYKRFFAYSDMSVEFYVYKFSNTSSAEIYCNRKIDQIKSNEDYLNVSMSGAFAVTYDYGTQETGISWGFVKNIVFSVRVYTINIIEDPTDQLVDFTLLEREQILKANIIPEFPSSTMVLLILITGTLILAIYRKRINKF
jgi:hypothetical protein